MIISDKGRALIQRFEGCVLHAYQCQAGRWTVGYGHTGDVAPGMAITQHQADEILEYDLQRFEDVVGNLAPRCTGPQFSALVSFTFNEGAEALRTSTLLRLHNLKFYLAAANQFSLWNKIHVKGEPVTVPGLIKRRAAERALYLEVES